MSREVTDVQNAFIGKDGLKDELIIKALHRAAHDFANGELSEVQDVLNDIVYAIQEFNDRCEKAGGCV